MLQSFIDTMIAGERYLLIFQGLGVTLLIAICAILIGTVLGCIFALMKVSDNKVLRVIANIYTTVLRGIPLATQLMIFYFVVAGMTVNEDRKKNVDLSDPYYESELVILVRK